MPEQPISDQSMLAMSAMPAMPEENDPESMAKQNNARALRRDVLATLKMLLPILLLGFVGTFFHTFVMHAVEANPIINTGMIAISLYGSGLIFARLVSLQRDFRTVERFGFEAGQGTYMEQLLEQPWMKGRYVTHYLRHIAQTGGTVHSQLDQNAMESELHALSTEYESRMELPQFLVGFMIAMGLLGTFIGLLETLTGIAGMLDGMGSGGDIDKQFTALVAELRKPLAGMGIAFSASMFGLVFSLMLAIMMIMLRRFTNRTLSCARNVMHELTQLSRSLQPGVAQAITQLSPDEFEQLRTSEEKKGNPVPPARGGDPALSLRLDVLASKMERMLDAFETSIESTRRMHDLLGFGPRMKETAEHTLEEIKSLVVTHTEQQRLLQKQVDQNSDLARITNSVLDTQRQTHGEVLSIVKQVIDRLQKIGEGNVNDSRHLWEIKELVNKFNTAMSVDHIAAGLANQSLLLETLIQVLSTSDKRLEAIHRDLTKPAPLQP